MTWWLWLIVSVVGFIATGVLVATGYSYYNGTQNYTPDDGEMAATVFLWPIALGFFAVFTVIRVFDFAHKRGETRDTRLKAREVRKSIDMIKRELTS